MILARHAEALFWAGRQLERVEHTTRALDVSSRNVMHYLPGRASIEWRRLVAMLGLSNAAESASIDYTQSDVTRFLFADQTNAGSVIDSAQQIRENVRTVRDRVPVELWEEANRLHLMLAEPSMATGFRDEPFEVYSSVRRMCQTLTGIIEESMPRDEGYAFMSIGRMLERSSLISRLLRVMVLDPADDPDLPVALRLASSLQAYRRAHAYEDDPTTVAMFLLRTENVPRSVLSCLRAAEARLAPLEVGAPGLGPARTITGRLRSDMEFGPLVEELRADPIGRLHRLEADVAMLAHTIAVSAFDPAHAAALTTQFVRPGMAPR